MDITLERILKLLKSSGKRQKELTDFLGISANSFTNWKLGLNTSYKKYVYAIAEFFDVSVEYLNGETNEEKPKSEDNELTEYLEFLKYRPEGKMLFSVAKGCTKEEIEQAVKIIEALRKPKDDA